MTMPSSILLSGRKVCGIAAENTDFDADIILHTNAVLATLQQLGVGPENGYCITGESETWTDYLGADSMDLNQVPSYVAAKVRLIFDPPVSSAVHDSLSRLCTEFEWRINVAAENKWQEEGRI